MTTTLADAFVLCEVAGTTYAVRTSDVLHMEMVGDITPVPNASANLDGVVLSRGRIVPVLNLRARFGFERTPHDLRTRVIVVRTGERAVGLLVDAAREFVRIPPEGIQPPGGAVADRGSNYLDGVASLDGRLVLVLDVARVIDVPAEAGSPPAGAHSAVQQVDR
jgi:purine-binding chemotaxis protein CheW